MPTNRQIIEKYKNEKVLIKTLYQIKDSGGNISNVSGIVTFLDHILLVSTEFIKSVLFKYFLILNLNIFIVLLFLIIAF